MATLNMIAPYEGRYWLLNQVATFFSLGMSVRLFKNNITPGPSSVLADFTQADYSGYSAQAWTSSALSGSADGSGRAYISGAQLTFAHSGGGTSNTVYGVYVVQTGSGVVLLAKRLATPKTMSSSDHFIKVTPRYAAQTEYS